MGHCRHRGRSGHSRTRPAGLLGPNVLAEVWRPYQLLAHLVGTIPAAWGPLGPCGPWTVLLVGTQTSSGDSQDFKCLWPWALAGHPRAQVPPAGLTVVPGEGGAWAGAGGRKPSPETPPGPGVGPSEGLALRCISSPSAESP